MAEINRILSQVEPGDTVATQQQLPVVPGHLQGWRNLFRFRLRTLLLAFTAVSVWLAFHVQSTRVQRQSAASIAQYGGWIRYDFQFPAGDYSHKGFDSKARSPVPSW